MILDSRRLAILSAMGIDAWHLRAAGGPQALSAPVHPSLERTVDSRAPNAMDVPMSVTSVRARAARARFPESPTSGVPDASAALAHAPSSAARGSSSSFEPVALRLWRTARALFIVSTDDVAPVRFLQDVQRALDHDPRFGLRDVPPFAWPPRDHPELGNVESLRSAWGALLRRIHREQPLSLVLVFGAEARGRLADMARLTKDAGAIDPSPRVHVAPLLEELLASAAARRALWVGLRDR